ncbi:PatB family C-S lyase [Cellulomonas sp. NPDC089187]|uniref:MalY/PatB family protein n=1 Tax=Cellulomonas sp. NPDC089187 TaxID=3154970 RepID=UPI0034374A1B
MLLHPIDHTDAQSVRWDDAVARVGDDVIALSVADMDLAAPEPVIRAVVERARRGGYGYTQVPPGYRAVVADWLRRRQGWAVDPEHILPVGRVVEAVPALLHELTDPFATVVVPTPAYAPVTNAVEANGRRLLRVPMIEVDGRPTLDMTAMAVAMAEADALILTGPHNPTGRVWTRAELTELAEIAECTDTLVIADEVHGDLTLPGHRHIPFASVMPEMARRTITFSSPGKTFNMAGLESSHAIIADPQLRARAAAAFDRAGFHNPRYFASAATVAAYTEGEPWLTELLALLDHHVDLLRTADLPGIRLVEPEGTHLAWLDCRGWTADEAEIERATHTAGLVLSLGSDFGPGNDGFVRINLAVPTDLFTEAIARLARARAGSPTTTEERNDA